MFLGVDWGSFVLVFLVALAATAAVVVLYAVGLRLLAGGALEETVASLPGEAPAGGLSAGGASAGSSGACRAGGWACIGVAGLAVLYALYLIIPQLH